MNRKSKHARLLELGKDVLIVLLACSAVWLTTRVQLIPSNYAKRSIYVCASLLLL